MGKRPGFFETIRLTRRTLRARGVFLKTFAFTAPVPADRVVEAIERRWGREVQDELDFYVESVIPGQQVILVFGKTEVPRIFAARIDFQSRDPAAGTLWFFDGKSYALGTESAEVFHIVFARLLAEVSPDAEIHEHDGEIVIATTDPDPDWRARRGSHRKK
jgi:hypothetical protein